MMIKSIVPATGWYAEFEDMDGVLYVQPIILWAVTRKDGGTKDWIDGVVESDVGYWETLEDYSDKLIRTFYDPDGICMNDRRREAERSHDELVESPAAKLEGAYRRGAHQALAMIGDFLEEHEAEDGFTDGGRVRALAKIVGEMRRCESPHPNFMHEAMALLQRTEKDC